jgi:NTE family protein
MKGLVLSGGGRKGAFQVGVLSVLAQRGAQWDFLAGTSVGAINAAHLAAYPATKTTEAALDLLEMWLDLSTGDVWQHWFLGPATGVWKDSFFNARPLHQLLRRKINEEAVRSSGRKLRLGIVEYGSGRYFEATENSTPLWKYVAASSSYPGGLNPVTLPEGFCGDGGAVSATPLKSAIDAGCTAIDIVVTDPLLPNRMNTKENWLGTRVSAISIVLRSVSLLMHTAMMQDVERLMRINKDVESGADQQHRVVEVNVYAPEHSLTSSPVGSLDFDPRVTRDMVSYGRQVTSSQLGGA